MVYYWAANLQKVNCGYNFPLTDWCKAEAYSCTSISLPALLTMKLPFSPVQYTSNPVVSSTLKIWSQFRQTYKLKDFSMLSPLSNNPLFPAGQMDHTYVQWQSTGLAKCSDFYIDNIFSSFNDLRQKFQLTQSDLFRYFQVRHFIQSQSSTFPNLPPTSLMDKILQNPVTPQGQISALYNMILLARNNPIEKIKEKWTKDIGSVIIDEIWDDALKRVNGSTSFTRLSLIQFKVLHCIYYTKSKLSKIYSNVEDSCDRCKSDKADIIHMFWSCQKLNNYWALVFKLKASFIVLNTTPCVENAIFGVPEHGIHLTNNMKNVFAFASLFSRRRILLEWKSKNPLKISMWICDFILFLKLEKIKYLKKGSIQKFYKIWKPMIAYFEKMKTLPSN
ncbi:uncharacterized protein LOC125245329 [Megalobrama amblycephala]|uniref:uncharacterized protein LOC125245329 n=1 Tax=Megalobrama amblycephala TaxID=75352 RepID=UPI002013D1EC|nr:uncharacterized protein LOC125245329 [Megalobrama amblycephala]XP_048011813.1 uncharacterized protein LOC125245329 [Megalobrama amblycephala]